MITSASEAVKNIKSGSNVFIHSAAAVPKYLVNAMTARHSELREVSIYQIHTEGRLHILIQIISHPLPLSWSVLKVGE